MKALHPDLLAAASFLATLEDRPPATSETDPALYGWYLSLDSATHGPATTLNPFLLDPTQALEAAHVDTTRFVGGWQATAVTALGVSVCRRGSVRHVTRTEYRVPARPGLPARPGDMLKVRSAWTWTDLDHGFWYSRRGTWPPPGADRLLRTYLNVDFRGAARVVTALTALMDDHPTVSYHLKVSTNLGRVQRADAAVLYLGQPDAERLRSPLCDVGHQLRRDLLSPTPRFTKRLDEGLAQAESPLTGESFGLDRCRLMDAAWRALDVRHRREPPAIADKLLRVFVAAGLDPGNPHLLAAAPRGR